MHDNCWLDFRQGPHGLGGPILMENVNTYKGLTGLRRLVMLVRGKYDANGGLRREGGVQLESVADTVTLVDCASHLQDDWEIPKLMAGPQAVHLVQHPTAAGQPVAVLAHRLYSTVIAPLSSAVVFVANEFGGVPAIIHLLATWIRHTGGQRQQYRPRVFIVREKETARLPGDLESRMTAAVLATCNPTRELTAKAAASLWRNCFSDITAVIHTDGDEVGAIRRTISLSVEDASACPALPGFARVLRTACMHFAGNPGAVVSVIQAARALPMPEGLPIQLEALLDIVKGSTHIILRSARLLVAVALLTDVCLSGLEGMFPPSAR